MCRVENWEADHCVDSMQKSETWKNRQQMGLTLFFPGTELRIITKRNLNITMPAKKLLTSQGHMQIILAVILVWKMNGK